MIFSPPLYGRVLAGRKTQTRRLVASGDLETKYRVGMRKAVQKGRGIHGEAHIILTDVRRERLGAIAFDSARAEGFRTTAEFKAYWVGLHDKAWAERWEAGQQKTLDGQTVEDFDEYVRVRFAQCWAHKQVWVLTFELDHSERPRLLADRNARADYVESPSRALSGSADPGEAVDARTQDRFSREGIQGFIARERARELDRELLAAEDRMRLTLGGQLDGLLAEAVRVGVATSKEVRVIEKRLDAIRRGIGRAA